MRFVEVEWNHMLKISQSTEVKNLDSPRTSDVNYGVKVGAVVNHSFQTSCRVIYVYVSSQADAGLS